MSTDYFLGMPYNVAAYAFMLEFFAAIAGFTSGETVVTSVDAHVYSNHDQAVDTQLGRDIRPLPTLKFSDSYSQRLKGLGGRIDKNTPLRTIGTWIDEVVSAMDVRADVIIEGYDPHPAIAAEVAV